MDNDCIAEERPTAKVTQYLVIEWPTIWLTLGCYTAWLASGMMYAGAGPIVLPLLVMAIALHSSLQHEAIHGHPTRSAAWNEALVCLPIGLLMPFRRYRSLHLSHHDDGPLTDPRVDPESFYLTADDYRRVPSPLRTLLGWNNTLVGRIIFGPAISTIGFFVSEIRTALRSSGAEALALRRAWALHGLGLAAVAAIIHFAFAMPAYVYLGATYAAMSILAVRSYCEHQWAEAPDGRTVIVESPLLGWLFLNNNLHLVHHKHPGLPGTTSPPPIARGRMNGAR